MVASANKHYAGFGSATANTFWSTMGLPETVWKETNQSRLADCIDDAATVNLTKL